MNILDKLYAERDTFLKYGQNVPADLAKAIKDAEYAELDNSLEMFKGYLPEGIDVPNIEKIVFAAEYDNGKLIRVGSSCSIDISNVFDNIKKIDENSDDPEPDHKRNPSIGFTVKFADGKEIKHTTARRTMIEALRYMGLERASKYRGEIFKGYPLIGKEKRPTEPRRIWQQNVDGWWIYVNMSNQRAITCLTDIAKMLGIKMEIIMDNDKAQNTRKNPPLHTPKPKGKRAQFSVNGSFPLAKNRCVLETIRLFMQDFPNASFKQVEEKFPRELQGSYGVVRSIEDIKQRGKTNKTEKDRWFLDPKEILTAADGIRFAVSNEWGDNFTNFQKHVADNLGWELKEV